MKEVYACRFLFNLSCNYGYSGITCNEQAITVTCSKSLDTALRKKIMTYFLFIMSEVVSMKELNPIFFYP